MNWRFYQEKQGQYQHEAILVADKEDWGAAWLVQRIAEYHSVRKHVVIYLHDTSALYSPLVRVILRSNPYINDGWQAARTYDFAKELVA